MATNEKTEKTKLIKKLQKIYDLYANVLNIKYKIENFVPDDTYERNVLVPQFSGESKIETFDQVQHEARNAVETIGELYNYYHSPKKPEEPAYPKQPDTYTEETTKINNKYGLRTLLCTIFGVCSLLGTITLLFDGFKQLPVETIIFIIITCVLGYFVFDGRKKLAKAKEADAATLMKLQKEYIEEVAKLKRQYDEEIEVFESNLALHNSAREDFLIEYKAWRDIFLQHVEEEAEIEEKLENDRIVATKKIYEEEYIPALNTLNKANDLVSNDYLPALETIIDLLETNRADSLKEAINLFEEIVYRERQLQLQKEQEEQRRYEEELRRQDEERRYREEMAFKEQQEINRQNEERERQRIEERHYQEEMAFREQQERNRQRELEQERRKQDKVELQRKMDQDRATHRQCHTCALVGRCSVAFSRPNCASYQPR
ncbi:MAG: hypothetical protein E7556_07530 [Ruminococcaceae bacterium]|nr:hypothetical protein [Oscillospiraceae bacterium]